ncbi:uncharacterized protein LOC132760138 [Ruditapes philippinarum]|uniref:uncharacterized protein LOC132760138 n=1 Tax=Ruditapes philippinarum TaxID=129788 RepID=UPI00295ACF14|nr:uncharacterized protein LOC132760138 [Ruditapes philippinarum]
MAMLRINKDLEMESNIMRQQKLAAGQSQLDRHINSVLLQASLRRPPVSVRMSGSRYSGSNKITSSAISGAQKAASKLVWSKVMLSKGSTVMKSTCSTRMIKSPKYVEKAFPNHKHDVIETSIIRLVPKYDFEIPSDQEFEKLIKNAYPKPVRNQNNFENTCLTKSDHSCKSAVESNIYCNGELNNEYDSNVSKRPDNEFRQQLENENQLKANVEKDKIVLRGVSEEIKNQALLTHDTDTTLPGHEIKTSFKTEIDLDEIYDIGLFFEVCSKLNKENVNEVYDIGLFFEVCNQSKKEEIDDIYDLGLFFEVCNQSKKAEIDEVYDIGLFFEVCNQSKKEEIDEVYDIDLFFEVCNQSQKAEIDEVYDIDSFLEVCNRSKKSHFDDVFDIGVFFGLCCEASELKKTTEFDNAVDDDPVFDPSNNNSKIDVGSVLGHTLTDTTRECTVDTTRHEVNENNEDDSNMIDAQNMDIAPLPRLDENIDFGEDMFGILGVFCRSGLHQLYSDVQDVNA